MAKHQQQQQQQFKWFVRAELSAATTISFARIFFFVVHSFASESRSRDECSHNLCSKSSGKTQAATNASFIERTSNNSMFASPWRLFSVHTHTHALYRRSTITESNAQTSARGKIFDNRRAMILCLTRCTIIIEICVDYRRRRHQLCITVNPKFQFAMSNVWFESREVIAAYSLSKLLKCFVPFGLRHTQFWFNLIVGERHSFVQFKQFSCSMRKMFQVILWSRRRTCVCILSAKFLASLRTLTTILVLNAGVLVWRRGKLTNQISHLVMTIVIDFVPFNVTHSDRANWKF